MNVLHSELPFLKKGYAVIGTNSDAFDPQPDVFLGFTGNSFKPEDHVEYLRYSIYKYEPVELDEIEPDGTYVVLSVRIDNCEVLPGTSFQKSYLEFKRNSIYRLIKEEGNN